MTTTENATGHAAPAAEGSIEVPPVDEHNRKLVEHTHPPGWENPTPSGRYNLVVIGGGTAGLVAAVGAAGLGAKVALIERHLMGGDCLNYGCVPSKGLISAARRAAEVRDAGEYGVRVDGAEVDFGAVMERMRKLRADIAPHDGAARFRDLGVDVYMGHGRFVGRGHIEVDGTRLAYKKAVIATGGRAVVLPIEGLAEAEPLTNESLFSLTELPKRLAVIGSGPIGAEMAQCFARFGSRVTLLEMGPHILGREDPDAAAVVQAAFERDGIDMLFGVATERVSRDGDERVLHLSRDGETFERRVDAILVAVGRTPNVEGLGLEEVGVEFDARKGVTVDDTLRTSVPDIFAAGDICSKYQFTHTADFLARIVIQNALFGGRKKASALTVPWATYTDPEIAHVGMYARDAEEAGVEIDTWTRPFAEVDRAMLDGETEGFVKIHTVKGTDRIVGATIVGRHAGDMISEVSTAMAAGLGLGGLASVIHPYPTQAEAIRQLGDQFNRTKLTPFVKALFGKWLAWTR